MKKSLLCAALLTSMLSFGASAELIHSDWKTAGDGLTTIDTNTGLEFLKLTETANHSINDVKSEFGSTYSGWRFATNEEVFSMMESIYPSFNLSGISSADGQRAKFNGPYQARPDYMGMSIKVNPDDEYTFGLTYNESGNHVMTGGIFSKYYQMTTIYVERAWTPYTDTYSELALGVWLVRDDSVSNVSAPLALSSLALLGFGVVRRRKPTNKDIA